MNIKDLLKVIRDFPAVVRVESGFIRQDAYYQGDPIPSKDWALLESLVYSLIHNLFPVICIVTGKHNFIDDTDASAGESGHFSYYCDRCGFGQSGYMTG